MGDNTTITHIWLGHNDITSDGVEYLITTLESNPTIVYLELDGNEDISPEREQEVISILKPRGDAFESEPETDDELESNGSESEVDEVEQLMERGVKPNIVTLSAMIDTCAKAGN